MSMSYTNLLLNTYKAYKQKQESVIPARKAETDETGNKEAQKN